MGRHRPDRVFASWVTRCEPSPDEEAEMLAWFDYLEATFEPPVALLGRVHL